MAYFTSLGENPQYPDIMKPDITAPGLQILAAWTPHGYEFVIPEGETFVAIQGTSMASPHVAGVFALIKQAFPHWSASTAKSAVMTTAYQKVLKNDKVTAANAFERGSGHVSHENKWLQPGVVYDA
ncbi:MAG: S8 family serine peptidase, partial [Gaiellaceae bacterium]